MSRRTWFGQGRCCRASSAGPRVRRTRWNQKTYRRCSARRSLRHPFDRACPVAPTPRVSSPSTEQRAEPSRPTHPCHRRPVHRPRSGHRPWPRREASRDCPRGRYRTPTEPEASAAPVCLTGRPPCAWPRRLRDRDSRSRQALRPERQPVCAAPHVAEPAQGRRRCAPRETPQRLPRSSDNIPFVGWDRICDCDSARS